MCLLAHSFFSFARIFHSAFPKPIKYKSAPNTTGWTSGCVFEESAFLHVSQYPTCHDHRKLEAVCLFINPAHTLSSRPVPRFRLFSIRRFAVFLPFEGQLSFLTEHLPVDSKPTELRSIAVDAETCSTLQSSTKYRDDFPRFMERLSSFRLITRYCNQDPLQRMLHPDISREQSRQDSFFSFSCLHKHVHFSNSPLRVPLHVNTFPIQEPEDMVSTRKEEHIPYTHTHTLSF